MRLTRHCHALLGFGYVPPWTVNAGIVWGESRTLIVDTGPTAQAAATILGYAEAVRPGNTIVAIDTERHLDHIAGNALLRSRGIEVHGHPSVRRSDAELAEDVRAYCESVADPVRRAAGEGTLPFLDTRIADPSVDVEHDGVLDLGGIDARVLLAPGHTPSNLLVWVAAEGVLYTGDTVVSSYRPNLESGGPAEWRLWLEALERVERLEPTTLVPGHGRVLQGAAPIAAEVARVRRCLREALERA